MADRAPSRPVGAVAALRQLVHDLRHGTVDDGEVVSPHVPPPLPTSRNRIIVRAGLAAAAGLAGLLLIAATAPVWSNAPASWRLTVPGLPHPPSSFAAGFVFVVGVVLAGLGWLGLVGLTDRVGPRRGLQIVVAMGLLWAVPVLLGPPLLSNDVYSYSAQGEMITRGIDPTADGPVMLGRGEFLYPVDPVWRTAPAPYGPVSILTSEGVVRLAGHDPATAVWLFRLLAVGGVVMSGVGVVLLARSLRVQPATALALGITSPLVLIHFVGGVHNDALMMGFLLLGLAAERRGRRVLTVLLLTCAAAVKLPAALALVVVAWVWAGKGAPFRRRVASLVKVGLSSLAILAVLCVLAGIGIGWILALRDTGKVMDTFSLMTILGYFATDLAHLVGIAPESGELLVGPVRLLGLVVGVASAVWLLGKAEAWGIARVVGLGMLAMVLLGPVVWPWYLPAGFALLAASGVGRFRPSYIVVVGSVTALVWPNSVAPVEWLLRFQRVLSFIVIVAIAGAAWGAQVLAARRQAAREADEADTGADLDTGEDTGDREIQEEVLNISPRGYRDAAPVRSLP